jgi:hypothetical protein
MKLQKGSHNFENDILMAAKNIGKQKCNTNGKIDRLHTYFIIL